MMGIEIYAALKDSEPDYIACRTTVAGTSFIGAKLWFMGKRAGRHAPEGAPSTTETAPPGRRIMGRMGIRQQVRHFQTVL